MKPTLEEVIVHIEKLYSGMWDYPEGALDGIMEYVRSLKSPTH